MPNDIGFDLDITKIKAPRTHDGGVWVCGTAAGYYFQALAFRGHATDATYELGTSRITKLWVERQADRQTTFNFDRGLDLAATDATTAELVAFLAAGLAEHVFGV